MSSKVRAKLSNRLLHIELPKKNATGLKKQKGTTYRSPDHKDLDNRL